MAKLHRKDHFAGWSSLTNTIKILDNRVKFNYDLAAEHHRDTNVIPPWMGSRAEEFLSLYEPFPDDFGIPEFITPEQYRIEHERDCAYEDFPERRMAWRLFAITVGDCLNGKAEKRLSYIKDIKAWIDNEVPDVRWSFDYWCSLLGYDESWVKGKLLHFLDTAERFASMGEQPNSELMQVYKEVVSKYKSRPAGKRKNNMSRQELLMEQCSN